MFVARVPLGRFDLQPQYWNGGDWVAGRAGRRADQRDPRWRRQPDAAQVDRRTVDVGGEGQRLERQRCSPRHCARATRAVDNRADGDSAQPNRRWAHQHVRRALDAVAVGHRQPRGRHFEQRVADEPAGTRQPDRSTNHGSSSWPATWTDRSADSRRPRNRSASCRRALRFARWTHARVLGSRGGQTLRVPLAGIVPAGARAAVIDLAAVDPSGDGYLTAWSCDQAMPPTSNLNYIAGTTRATHSVVTSPPTLPSACSV